MPTIDELASQVAALEQQMAAITTPPDKYYTSIYSGEEIDAAITKVRSGAMGVSSFNGRAGAVMPQAGDYNAAQIPVSADAGAETVAAALNNKAPAGYGLGAESKLTTDYNQATANGWYYNTDVGDIVHSPDGAQWWCHVTTFSTFVIRQEFYAVSPIPKGWLHAVRWYHPSVYGGWSDFDWVNPPMIVGVEYRTTERYNGKPVFVMAVDGGVFPDNSLKAFEVQIPNTSGQVKMLDCYGVLDNGTQIPGLYGSAVFAASDYLGLFTQNGHGKFTISVGSGRTVGLNFTLFLKYWKE